MNDELSGVKNIWETFSEANIGMKYSSDELRKMVKRQSKSELFKIRRKIIIEWLISFSLVILFLIYQMFFGSSDTLYALIFLVFVFILLCIPLLKLMHLNMVQQYDLKSHISEFLKRFNKVINQYVKMAMFLMPISYVVGLLIVFNHFDDWSSLCNWRLLIKSLLIVVVLNFVGYWLIKRYYKWIYGSNIKRLEDCLRDLNDVEDKV